jgi:hypothetical protein
MTENPNYSNRLLLICLFSCSLLIAGFIKINTQTVDQWQRWKYSLTSHHAHSRKPVSLDVTFYGSGGRTFHTPAYSDDDSIFHFSAAFPSSGIWRWKTTCSDSVDAGLHNKKGKVKVKSYKGKNPLYIHGDLRVSDDKRYIAHADDTPFLWIGETSWYVTRKSTMEEWREYVDIRVDQRFSVLQIVPQGTDSKNTTSAMRAMLFKKDGTPDHVFWRELEDKVAYANDKGLFVMLVGVGKQWKDLFAENPHNQPFEAYLTGRFAGLMVIFSPSLDQLYDPGNNNVAEELKLLTLHLVTQHPGTNYDANIRYRNAPSVDFCGLQSGHHNGNLMKAYSAARTWTLDMWNGVPVKPVIDIEAMYDAYGNDYAKNWREKDARKLGWIAWLSGSMGYTYGAGDIPPKVSNGRGGIWMFNKDSFAYDYWRTAMMWPSSHQMTNMYNFFESIEWWQLLPAHELILNQSEDDTLKMVVSINRERELLLAYLPDNQTIILNLKDISGTMKGKWFNPVNGNIILIDRPVIKSSRVSFSRPEGWEDAVLLLIKS